MTYKIELAGWFNDKLKIKPHYYNDEQEAVNAVTEALERNEYKFRIVKEGNRTSFRGVSPNVELVAVVPH